MINEKILKKDIYSTKEVKTNKTWNDKPVYRRVFMYNNIALNSSTQLDAVIDNLDFIFKADFYYKLSQSEIRPFPTLASNGTSLLQARWSGNKIQFTGSDSWTAGSNRYVIAIIEYTKTTD